MNTNEKYRLLIIDDDKDFQNSVKVIFNNYYLEQAYDIKSAEKILVKEFDLILLDLVFDNNNPYKLEGLEFLPEIKKRYPDTNIIILTNYVSTDITVSAIKSGAIDFVNKKDIDWTIWKNRIYNYCKNSDRIKELQKRTKNLENQYDRFDIIGNSPQIKYLRKRLKDLANFSNDIPVFIYGETGTGKNLAVNFFRQHSNRIIFKEFSLTELSESLIESELFGHIKGAFTGAVQDKKGLFEEADKGILFLDEIGDYDIKIQMKIMRFVENHYILPVGSSKSKLLDVQLILATNRDINQLINTGKFRNDLYQRINKVRIDIPPLRERDNDIDLLTEYYFNYFNIKEKANLISVSDEVIKIFRNYHWPGNIRELQSVIWDACTKARLENDKHIKIIHLKNGITANDKFFYYGEIKKDTLNKQLDLIEKALVKTYGQKNKSAEYLNLNLDKLRYIVLKNAKQNYDNLIKYPAIKKYYGKLIDKYGK